MSRIISSEEAGNFKAWQLPDVGNSQDIPQPSQDATTPQSLDEMIRQAKEEAFAQGVAHGVSQAQSTLANDASNEWQQKVNQLDGLISSLNEPLNATDENVEKEILNLVMSMTQRLCRHELSINPEQVMTIVQEAKALLPANAKNIQIHVHPEDAALMRQAMQEKGDDSISAYLHENHELSRGDCKVVSDAGQIDATLEARINELANRILNNDGE